MNSLNLFKLPAPCERWNIFYKLKWHFKCLKWVCQRAKCGYCDADLWDLESFYLRLFVNSLRDFAKNVHGAPNEYFDKTLSPDEATPWRNYLNEIAQHFENAFCEETIFDKDIMTFKKAELEKGLEMLKKNFRDLWD